jgi:hypothetical protein
MFSFFFRGLERRIVTDKQVPLNNCDFTGVSSCSVVVRDGRSSVICIVHTTTTSSVDVVRWWQHDVLLVFRSQ